MALIDFTNFGGRRFVLAMGAGITTTLLQWYGKIDPAGNTSMAVVIGTVAAYITGQAAETKFTGKPPALPEEK